MKKTVSKEPAVTTALSSDALMGKSQAYMGRRSRPSLAPRANTSSGLRSRSNWLAKPPWREFIRVLWRIRKARCRFLPRQE